MSRDDDGQPVIDSGLERPYVASGGRTAPTARLTLITRIETTGRVRIAHVEPDHGRVLLLLRHGAMSVAELNAHLNQDRPAHSKLPVMVVKVILSDLLEWGAVQAFSSQADPTDTQVLEALLDGLNRRL